MGASSVSRRLAWTLVLVAWLVACGAPSAVSPPRAIGSTPTPQVPATSLTLRNHLLWPYSLAEIQVFIDGRPLELAGPSPRGAVGRRLSLEAGEHELRVHARVGVLTGSFESDCEVSLWSQKGFRSGTRPGEVTATLFLHDVTRSFSERVELAISVPGDAAVPLPAHTPRFDDRACRKLEPTEKALCRGQTAAAILERRRESVGVVCARNGIARLEGLARWVDASCSRGTDSGCEKQAALLREIGEVSSQLDLCFGEDDLVQFETTRSALPGCSSAAP